MLAQTAFIFLTADLENFLHFFFEAIRASVCETSFSFLKGYGVAHKNGPGFPLLFPPLQERALSTAIPNAGSAIVVPACKSSTYFYVSPVQTMHQHNKKYVLN